MRGIAPSRSGSGLARITSLVTLLALVVAPACGPLCAAQACTQAPVSAGMGSHCRSHDVANGGAAHLQSVQNCGLQELAAVVLTSTSLGNASGESRSSTPCGTFLAVERAISVPAAAFPDFYSGRSPDFAVTFSPAPPSILRVCAVL